MAVLQGLMSLSTGLSQQICPGSAASGPLSSPSASSRPPPGLFRKSPEKLEPKMLMRLFLSFFQVKYNNQCPKPCFRHSKERSCCDQPNTCSQSKKKKKVPISQPIKSFSSLSRQSDLLMFLKSDPNKAPELGELPGKPYTRGANFFSFFKIRVRK